MLPNATNGYLEVKVETWNDLQQYTNYFADTQRYVFRGQRDSGWELETSLDRYLRDYFNQDLAEFYKNKQLYWVHLQNFRESLLGRGLRVGEMSDNDLWALGQHYGLYTPLLDWSYSFYVALFFAFEKESEPVKDGDNNPKEDDDKLEKKYRSVYAVSASNEGEFGVRLRNYNEDKEGFQKFELIFSTNEDNPRVISQVGLFTKFPFDFMFKEWVQKHFNGFVNQVLIKIDIPETERGRVMRELNLMNINHKTIYPDLQGSSLDCNFKLFLYADKYNLYKTKGATG